MFYFEQGGKTISELNADLNSSCILMLNHLYSEIPLFLFKKKVKNPFNVLKCPHGSPSDCPASFPAPLCAVAEISNY